MSSFTVNTPFTVTTPAPTVGARGPTGNAPFPAVAGHAGALNHCHSEVTRLRHAWEEAKRRQVANEALAIKLVNAITPATKPEAASRLNAQATAASGQATDAGIEADEYAFKATTALNAFGQEASGSLPPADEPVDNG